MESIAEVVTWVIILGAIGLYVWAIVVCFQKGKPAFGWMGIAGVLMPFLGWFAIVGSIRLALPSSSWARSHYDADKVAQAVARFPDDARRLIAQDPTAIPGLTSEELPTAGRSNTGVVIVGGMAAVLVTAGLIVFAALALGDEIDAREAAQTGETISSYDIAPGDCINFPQDEIVETVERLDCAAPHDAEVYHLFDLAGNDYPGDEAVDQDGITGCVTEFDRYVGIRFEDSELDIFRFSPTAETWEGLDDREIVCMVGTLDGIGLTGSARSSSI